MKEAHVNRIGWFASLMAVLMFASYIDQIRLNISGQPGSILLPLATVLNCAAWSSYAWLKKNRDWPIFICNLFGVVVATITTITACIY